MQFNLEKDLCFLDIESTGSDVVNDRIVQLALVKYTTEGKIEEKEFLINPQKAMKPDAVKVHGITDEMVKDLPPFKAFTQEILDFIGNADLAGYNSNRFDVPLLIEEFARAKVHFSLEGRRLLDALQIFYKMEPRTLKAALKFYCNKELNNAHDALADTRATADVLLGQIQRYDGVDYIDREDKLHQAPIQNDVQALHDFVNDGSRVDFIGRFIRDRSGTIIFNFGSQKGLPAWKHPNTLKWIIQKDFPLQVKKIAQDILDGKLR